MIIKKRVEEWECIQWNFCDEVLRNYCEEMNDI